MAISDTWTLPAEAGNLDLDVGNTLGETQWDQLVSDVLYLYNRSAPFGQLPFPATQNASSGANTLDDYEEGTWTPQLDQGASTNITKTITEASYVKIGKSCTLNMRLDPTAAGTAGSAVTVTTPFTGGAGAFDTPGIGSGVFYDASAGTVYAGISAMASTTKLQLMAHASNGNWVGVSPNVALANGDQLIISAVFITNA